MNCRRFAVLCITWSLLNACAVSPVKTSPGSMSIQSTEDLQAITDVDRRFGAVRYGNHAVAIRLWPDSLEDGLAEITVIVTNGGWNTISLDAQNIATWIDNQRTPAIGKQAMLDELAIQATNGRSTSLASRVEGPAQREAGGTTTVSQGAAGRAPTSSGFGSSTNDPGLGSVIGPSTPAQRPRGSALSDADIAAYRASIDSWYLDSVAIYPGDTATGGISIAVPAQDADLELQVAIGDEVYSFPVRYRIDP